MANIVLMYAPPGLSVSQVQCTMMQNSGQTYIPDPLGFIIADPRDIPELLRAGFSVSALPLANFRNLIDGGDFTVNPLQRNIPGLATAGVLTTPITATPTYFADRFFAVGGASSAILMAAVADTTVPSFSQSLQVYRQTGNANNAQVSFGQVLETADCIRCQGQQYVLSAWLKALANFSAAGQIVTVSIITGTGSNQSAASLVAGSWIGYAVAATQNVTLSQIMSRIFMAALIPATATQIGLLIQFTPVGTALAGDGFQINGIQFEKGTAPSPFEHRDVQVELEICQRYAWMTPEPANLVQVGVGGCVTALNSQSFYMATPVQLRASPTVTLAAGSWKVAAGAAAAAAVSMTPGTTHTPNAITVTTANTEAAAGVAALVGGGGNGWILASADY